jgi:hypothetical protein
MPGRLSWDHGKFLGTTRNEHYVFIQTRVVKKITTDAAARCKLLNVLGRKKSELLWLCTGFNDDN